jgi:hypothetical protein
LVLGASIGSAHTFHTCWLPPWLLEFAGGFAHTLPAAAAAAFCCCVPRGEVEQIVDAFPGQSIDFFGALRARVYDDKVGL